MPNLRINAGPGCGKSHVLANIFMYIRATNRSRWENVATDEQKEIYEWCRINLPESCHEKCAYYAYNDDIVQQMKGKVHPNTECRTSHGWGYKIVNAEYGYVPIHKNPLGRSYHLITELTGRHFSELDNKERYKWLAVINYIPKLKEELMTPNHENFQILRNKYADLAPYNIFDGMDAYASKMMQKMKIVDRKVGIEYVDQLWLAAFLAKKPIYSLGLVDEDQDLSPLRLRLARLLFENIVFCGDENQAINMFAGADPNSVENIRKVVDHELPMKITFRNTPDQCNYLNALIPKAKLRPHPEKQNGVEARLSISELGNHLRKLNTAAQPDELADHEFNAKHTVKHGLNEWGEALILCRYNAPLIRACMELIKRNMPCYILGNTLINNLISIVNARKATCMEELYQKLDTWLSICTRNVPDIVAMQLEDKVKCIKLVAEQVEYPEDIPLELKKMLKPKNSSGLIRLSTIHRSKGLEAKHVFILFPPIEYPKCNSEMEKKQEKHLHFVAYSRSSCNIYWVYDND